jgi:antitoxin VapB
MRTAKLFQTGGSQAVRLPKEFRFDAQEVSIEKDGDRVILSLLKRTWSPQFWDCLGGASEDLERAPQRKQRRGTAFR